MKKLIIATVTVLTTMGISAYTKDNSRLVSRSNEIENNTDVAKPAQNSTDNTLISSQIGRADLAQAD